MCPYCGNRSQFIDSTRIYGSSYGMIYYCQPCAAWVGVHKGTNQALGRLANAELREWKKEAHRLFDGLWRKKMQQGNWQHIARNAAYQWLSKEMGLPPELTHIGMFDVAQCKQVVALCKKYYK